MSPDNSGQHPFEMNLEQLTKEQLIVIAMQASELIEWEVEEIRENGLLLNSEPNNEKDPVKISMETDGEKVRFDMNAENVSTDKEQVIVERINKLRMVIDSVRDTLKGEELDRRVEEFLKEFNENAVEEEKTNWYDGFHLDSGNTITYYLIAINCVIFIIMAVMGAGILEPDSETLINWGANYTVLTLDGQVWRLLTSCFLHAGIIHLLFNMYALLYIGLMLEPILGSWKFIFCYLLTGLFASLTSLWWHDMVVGVGASGAIFGMYGIFIAVITTENVDKSARAAMLKSMGIFIGYNLIMGLKSGIDNAAHIGGLVSGLIIGYLLFLIFRNRKSIAGANTTAAAFAVIAVSAALVIYRALPRDPVIFNSIMEEFSGLEHKALGTFRNRADIPMDEQLMIIEKDGIPSWEKMISITRRVEKLHISDNLLQRNILLRQYCEYRLASFKMLAAFSRNPESVCGGDQGAYVDSLRALGENIKRVLSELDTRAKKK